MLPQAAGCTLPPPPLHHFFYSPPSCSPFIGPAIPRVCRACPMPAPERCSTRCCPRRSCRGVPRRRAGASRPSNDTLQVCAGWGGPRGGAGKRRARMRAVHAAGRRCCAATHGVPAPASPASGTFTPPLHLHRASCRHGEAGRRHPGARVPAWPGVDERPTAAPGPRAVRQGGRPGLLDVLVGGWVGTRGVLCFGSRAGMVVDIDGGGKGGWVGGWGGWVGQCGWSGVCGWAGVPLCKLPPRAPSLNPTRPLPPPRPHPNRPRSCINCMHILPDLAFLERKYASSPVAVVGVHRCGLLLTLVPWSGWLGGRSGNALRAPRWQGWTCAGARARGCEGEGGARAR